MRHVGTFCAFLGFAASLMAAPRVETLTDREGRQLRVIVFGVGDEVVRIRRLRDGSEFEIPLDRLSAERRELVLAGEKRSPAPVDEPGAEGGERGAGERAEWRRLRVTLPSSFDGVSGAGLSQAFCEKRSGRSYDLWLPVGCWVKANIKTRQKMLETLVRFEGEASRWEFRTHGPRVSLARDGDGEEIVGVTLEQGSVPADWFSKGAIPLAETLCVELQELGQIDRLAAESPVPVRAICATNYDLTDAEIASIADATPRALAIDLDYASRESLHHFEGGPLESCSLEFLDEPVERDGNRIADYPVTLPELPEMKYFSNYFTVAPADYAETLAEKTPALRTLTVSVSHPRAHFARFRGIDRFSRLESLNLPWGVQVQPDELLALPRLRVLRVDKNGLNRRNRAFSRLSEREALLFYANRMDQFPGEIMREWAVSGRMRSLVTLETFCALDFDGLEDVEVLKLRRGKKRRADFSLPSLGGLEALWYLKLNDATQEEIEEIGRLPNAGGLEALTLYRGSFSDLSVLESLVNLRRLELVDIDGNLVAIDLDRFPKLETLLVGSIEKLEEIRGLEAHSSLGDVFLSSCPALRPWEESFEHSNLHAIRLRNLDQFTDLSAFANAPLTHVEVLRCDGLTRPLGISLEALDYRLVYGCDNLTDRIPGK